jgi:signal transduction histidine kinase
MSYPLLTLEIRVEPDIVLARQRARKISSLLGFDTQEQTRIATAVSEVTRNSLQYAGSGKVEFLVEEQAPQTLLTIISETIKRLQGTGDWEQYSCQPEMSWGLAGAKRLLDRVEIESLGDRGTRIKLIKYLPKQNPLLTQTQLTQVGEKLIIEDSQDPFVEIQQQNQELLRTLAELSQRQDELTQLNQELEDTNRGVVALYAELSDKADFLKQASELKSKFLSNMSHEFRTPLNAIISLSEILLNRLDGDLTSEQEKQVTFIHKSAESLSELVNDLLDLAKVEAGKLEIRVTTFAVTDLFSTLRGMFRPLVDSKSSVNLHLEQPQTMIILKTDEGKLSQILRNLTSNALKYTEQGEVRITATLGKNQTIIFSVADTGIGIDPKHQSSIFEEFVQVDNPFQKKIKGTGLGLPLCKKLTQLLGGKIEVKSKLGSGSTFVVTLPIVYRSQEDPKQSEPQTETDTSEKENQSDLSLKILTIDDDEVDRYTIRSLLANIPCHLIEAASGYRGLELAKTEQPQVILLDLLMPGMTGFTVLEQLKSDPSTQNIPVIIITSKDLEPSERAILTASAVTILSKQSGSRQQAIARLQEALKQAGLNW